MNAPTRFLLPKPIHKLHLPDLLRLLVGNGHVEKASAEKLHKDRKRDTSNIHPIVIVAEQKWSDAKDNNKLLTIEWLTQFVAEQAEVDYYQIDPIKLDFTAASQIVSKRMLNVCALCLSPSKAILPL